MRSNLRAFLGARVLLPAKRGNPVEPPTDREFAALKTYELKTWDFARRHTMELGGLLGQTAEQMLTASDPSLNPYRRNTRFREALTTLVEGVSESAYALRALGYHSASRHADDLALWLMTRRSHLPLWLPEFSTLQHAKEAAGFVSTLAWEAEEAQDTRLGILAVRVGLGGLATLLSPELAMVHLRFDALGAIQPESAATTLARVPS